MSNQHTTAPNPGPRQKLSVAVIVLIVSIALNGLLAGLLISGGGPNSNVRPLAAVQTATVLQGNPRRLLRQLAPARRRVVIKQALKDTRTFQRGQYAQLYREVVKARYDVFAQAGSETLETNALDQALTDLQIANANLAEASNALLVRIFQNLTPEERETVLASYRDQHRRPGRKNRQNRR